MEILLPSHSDYHFYDLKATDILRIKRAKLIFISGIPLGGWELKIEETAKHKVIRFVENKKIKDPHIWMSPELFLTVSGEVYKKLINKLPEKREILRRNFETLKRKLESLDRLFSETLSGCSVRVLPASHPFLENLARDYGMKTISLSLGTSHGDVSPRKLLKFLRLLKEHGISFIFGIYGEETKFERVLKEDYGISVYRLDVKMLKYENYEDMMKYNLKIIKEALKCS